MNVAKESKLRRTKKLRESRVATSVARSYRVDFETSAHLCPQSDDGITAVVGKIIHEQNATVAGKLHGYCVRSERVAEIHRDLDDNIPHLYDVASLVWDPDEQTYRNELDLAMPVGNLIVPWTITLLPEHPRDRRLASLVREVPHLRRIRQARRHRRSAEDDHRAIAPARAAQPAHRRPGTHGSVSPTRSRRHQGWSWHLRSLRVRILVIA